jgi:hypothetical protein
VHSLVPEGFPAYVRVFHPAYRFDRESSSPWETWELVSWAEIADANQTQAHAGMQLPALTGSYHFLTRGQPGVYDHPPQIGSLPPDLRAALVATLSRHTSTPERCWFAVWNGFGRTREDIRQAPTFRVPAREYFLHQAPVSGAMVNVLDYDLGPGQTANIWWPDDRAWCVATEIDLISTYVACSVECRDDLLATVGLEALVVDPATGINWVSDARNPAPPIGQ